MKKRRWTSVFSGVLCAAVLSSLLFIPSGAGTAVSVSDVVSSTTKELTLSNGTKTGVMWTNLSVSGDTYGTNREVNIAEFDLANTNLSMEVINCGSYMVSATTLTTAATRYNNNNSGETVLAAVNGDLWMTSIHSNSAVTTATLKVPRGVCIVDGEIWSSQQISAENIEATNVERGTNVANLACFGVTSRNQPLIGSPDIQVVMTVNGKQVTASGLNRLPATNSIILYNHRVNSSNYALNDAYEVVLEAEDTAFKAGGTITATVKAIYPEGSTTRPSIGENTILITARGNRISIVKKNFAVGDTVTLSTTLTDRLGNTELWQDVQEGIGGHMITLRDGRVETFNMSTENYPTSLIGYKDDGTVALVTFTSASSRSRAALRFCDNLRFCYEIGYNTVFYLDGGGSSTFITLDEGSYTVRNQCSDGSPRAVINGIGVVWNDEKVCNRQGSLGYINIPADLSGIPATYLDGPLLAEIVSGANGVSLSYNSQYDAFKMTTNIQTDDPFATLDLAGLQTISADDYKYIVFKLKDNHSASSTDLALYYSTGSSKGQSGDRCKKISIPSGMSQWRYVTADMSGESNWTGDIRRIRLDIFDSITTASNVSMYIDSIVFCKTAEEAAKVQSGWTPSGAVVDYLAYAEESTRFIPDIGDINCDRNIDIKDATLLLKYTAGWDVELDDALADVNADGNIDLKDVTLLLKYVADWDVELG